MQSLSLYYDEKVMAHRQAYFIVLHYMQNVTVQCKNILLVSDCTPARVLHYMQNTHLVLCKYNYKCWLVVTLSLPILLYVKYCLVMLWLVELCSYILGKLLVCEVLTSQENASVS